MNIFEYSIKIFQQIITAVAFNIEDVAKNFPSAESITLAGTHSFIGDGSTAAQTITKATPIVGVFTGTVGTSTGTSHPTTPPATADLTFAKAQSVTFVGPAGCNAWMWELAGSTTVYGQNTSIRFENAGTFTVKMTCASDGGQADPQYMKLSVT